MDNYTQNELERNIYDLKKEICEFDIMLVDEQNNHLHYVELKDSTAQWDKADNQIKKAAHFTESIGYIFSASRVAWKQNRIQHYTRREVEDLISYQVDRAPIDLKMTISSRKPDDSQSEIPTPVTTREMIEMNTRRKDDEEETIVDLNLPHRVYKDTFHTHLEELEKQLNQRFDEVPDRDFVNVAYVPNIDLEKIIELQEMSPESYSELHPPPPDNLDEIMADMNIIHYPEWSEDIKKELDQEELKQIEDTFIVVKQPVEEIFDEKIL